MKIRTLVLAAAFALLSSLSYAQTLSTAAAAAFANAGGDLAKIAAVAKAFPGEAAAIARSAAKANPANAAQIAATVAKVVPSQAVNIVSEVVKESPSPESAGAIVGSVLVATGNTASSKIGEIRRIASAAVSSLPADQKTASNLKTFVQIVASTGAPESAARMGAYDGSGVGIVTISRAPANAAAVASGTASISAAVAAANTAEANLVPLTGGTNTNSQTTTNNNNNNGNNDTPVEQPVNQGSASPN
ncbi:MAG: hypothetical protein KF715_13260 [Candidatus Didemnitutus sp.]|nr:hypothetical protein [Candidatus Didemnitutus sp.]